MEKDTVERDGYVTINEACSKLNKSERQIRRMRRQAGCKSFTMGKIVYFDFERLLEFMRENNMVYQIHDVPDEIKVEGESDVGHNGGHDTSADRETDYIDVEFTDKESRGNEFDNKAAMQLWLQQQHHIERLDNQIEDYNDMIQMFRDAHRGEIEELKEVQKELICVKDSLIADITKKSNWKSAVIAAVLTISIGVSAILLNEKNKRTLADRDLENLNTVVDKLQSQLGKTQEDKDKAIKEANAMRTLADTKSENLTLAVKDYSDNILEANSKISDLETKLLLEKSEKEKLEMAFQIYKNETESKEKSSQNKNNMSDASSQLENTEGGSGGKEIDFSGKKGATNLLELAEKIKNNNDSQ